MMKLPHAMVDRSYTIVGVEADNPLKSRLLSMGFMVGAGIRLLTHTLARQTYDVEVGCSLVALRKEEAERIRIRERI